ncbi:MAG: MaoC family dehydratase N-terminal domain-containing protein [Burkholderiaceae bacterium]
MSDHPPPEIGRRFAPFSFVVEQAKVDELCLALHDDNPVFKRGAGRTPVPPTFLNSSIQTLVTGSNPVDVLGISRRRALHAGQEYEYLQPIHIGDTLQGVTTLTEVVDKQGRNGAVRFLTLETRFERDGELVAVVRNRVAERLGARSGG